MGYKLSFSGESTKMTNVSPSRMLLLSTFLICALIIVLGVVLGLKLYEKEECTPVTQQATPPTTPAPQPTEESYTYGFKSDSPEGHYKYAAVSSDAGPCAAVGTDLMARRGGSAIDAAVATILCQCVYHFHSCGIGGGFFMTVYSRETKDAYTIIAREMAPGEANETMYKDRSSTEGGLSVGIPGEIKGLWLAHQIGGKLPWKDLFQASIKMCRDGMAVSGPTAQAIAGNVEIIGRTPNLRELLTNPSTNKYFKEGEIIFRPKLANTLETIANNGADVFYNGSLAKDIVTDIQEAGGIITEEDLQKYVAVKKAPLSIKLNRNQTVYSPPPPSSGAVYEFILNILDGYRFTEDSISTNEASVLTWHRIIEAFKFAYAKRTNIGDGDAESQAFKTKLQQLIANLTSDQYAEEIRSKISDSQTHDTDYYGPTFYDTETTGTAHLSVLAPNGDAVSITSTINLYFGSKVVGTKTGIIFNNEMDDFSTPNTTNYYGVPASPANFIKPFKRPLSSMCPSIIVDGHDVVQLVAGASGGTKITTSTALVSILTQWLGLTIKEAIDHRRLHHQLLPPNIDVEAGFNQHIIDGLKQKGHVTIERSSAGCIVQGILQTTEGNVTANADFRKGGYPDGY